MKTMPATTQFSLLLIIILFYFYPAQSFSFQEIENEKSSEFPAALDNNQYGSEAVLVRYTEKNNLLREAEGGASLQIYVNGYAAVYFPAYMRHAGEYGFYLNQGDMARLWALLIRENILTFNKETVCQFLYNTNQSGDDLLAEISNVADAATTLIEIYPNRYKLTSFGDGSAAAMKKISWYGLRWDAQKYQDIPEIQDLIALQQELQAIMQRVDLKKNK